VRLLSGPDESRLRVRVEFTRPMRGLLPDREAGAVGVTLRPAVPGVWSWQGRSALFFESTSSLAPGVFHEVEVPAGLAAADGSVLPAATRATHRFSKFELREPVNDAEPLVAWVDRLPLLLFNDSIDPASAAASVSLVEERGDREIAMPIAVQVRGPRLDIRPSGLKVGGRYLLRVAASLGSTRGAHLDGPLLLPVAVPATMTARAVCRRERKGLPCESDAVALLTSSPVKPELLLKALRVDPPVKLSLESTDRDTSLSLDQLASEGATEAWFSGDFTPGVRYRVSLPGSLRDVHGRPLARPFSAHFSFSRELTVERRGADLFFQGPPGKVVQVSARRLDADDLWGIWSHNLSEDDEALWSRGQRPSLSLTLDARGRASTPEAALAGGATDFLVKAQLEDRAPVVYRFQGLSLAFASIALEENSLIQVLDTMTGGPAAGVTVEIRDDRDRAPLFSKKSGDDGTVQVSGVRADQRLAVLARRGDEAILSAFYPSEGHEAAPGAQVGLFPERAVYQAGEAVHLRGVARPAGQGAVGAYQGREVRLSLDGISGGLPALVSGVARVDEHGFFSADLRLPSSLGAGMLGDYEVRARLAGTPGHAASQRIELREFRKPELDVQVAFDRPEYIQGDPVRCSADVSLLSGERLNEGEARLEIRGSFTGPALQFPPYFSVSGSSPSESVARLPARGDPDSHNFSLERPSLKIADGSVGEAVAPATGVPLALGCSIEASALKLRGRGDARALLHPAEFYLGVKAPKGAESPRDFEVLALSTGGVPVAGVPVTVTLERVVEKGPRVGVSWLDNIEKIEKTDECSAVTSVTPVSCSMKPAPAGRYRVSAVATDRRGHRVVAYHLIDKTSDPPPGPPARQPQYVPVSLDVGKQPVAPGGVLRATVTTPFSPAIALMTLQPPGSSASLWHRVIELKQGETSLDIPTPRDMPPFARLVATVCQRRPEGERWQGNWGIHCEFADQGLPTADPPRALRVEVRPAAARVRPGAGVEVEVEVRGAGGEVVPSEVTLFAVDEGVLALGSWQIPSILRLFFPRDDLRKAASLGYGAPEWGQWSHRDWGWRLLSSGSHSPPVTAMEGPAQPRREGALTPCYHGALKTDGAGRARATCVFPGSLSSFRVVAVALALDEARGGRGEARVQTSQPLSLRPSLPRFARVGDRFDAAALLVERDGRAAEVQAQAQVSGALQGDFSKKIAVEAGGQARLAWPVEATRPGRGVIALRASDELSFDAVEASFEVLSPTGEEVVSQGGQISAPTALTTGDLARARGDLGGLTLVASGSAMAGLYGGLEQLIEYPYGCTEQLTSRLIPLVALRDLARAAGVALPADIDGAARDAVDRLAGHQRPDGGFGLWPSSHSEFWLTSYALWGLQEAQSRGIPVRPGVIEQALDHLAYWLRPQPGGDEPRADEPPSPDDVALAFEVLASAGRVDRPRWLELFGMRGRLSLGARGTLLRGLALAGLTDEAARLGAELDASFVDGRLVEPVPARRFDSPTRTLALLLRGRVAHDPRHPQVLPLVRALLAARRNGRWATTQEAAWALLALDAFRRARPEDGAPGSLDLVVGDDRRSLRWGGPADVASITLPWSALSSGTSLQLLPGGPTHYEARLRYAPREQPPVPRDEGFLVHRLIDPVVDDKFEKTLARRPSSVDHLPLGEAAMITVIFEAHAPLEDVAVTVPIPAGMEIFYRDLGASSGWSPAGISGEPTDGVSLNVHSSFVHREDRHDRAVFFLHDGPAGLHQVSFLVRATTAGKFQLPPAQVEAMYGPQRGASAGATFEVTPRP